VEDAKNLASSIRFEKVQTEIVPKKSTPISSVFRSNFNKKTR
jgi:hypothetical protein